MVFCRHPSMLLALFVGFLLLTGCDKNSPLEPAVVVALQPAAAPSAIRPLDELLKLPQEELAKRCEELLKEIERREKARRDGNLRFSLIDLHLPRVWPVF